jgi:hypothetical protein
MARFSFSSRKNLFHMQKSNPINKANMETKYKTNNGQIELFWTDYDSAFNCESLEFHNIDYTPTWKVVNVLD